MQAVNDTVDVTITSLGGLGDGIADLGGKPLFVAKACVGDRLRVRIIHQTKAECRAEIVEVLTASPERVTPPCPFFAECGGCTLQQLARPSYEALKRRIVGMALRHAGFGEVEPELAFLPPDTRRRVEWHLHHEPARSRLAYYKYHTHALVSIDQCLILEPALQAMIVPLTRAIQTLPKRQALTTISVTQCDSGIDMVLRWGKPEITALSDWAKTLADTLGIARISVQLPGGAVQTLIERRPVEMQLGAHAVEVTPWAFLQASREGQRLLTEAVISAVAGADPVVDLFAGIGSYSFPLSATSRVHAVEIDKRMVRNINVAIHRHGLLQRITAEQRDLFIHQLTARELKPYRAAIINPPRAGAKTQALQLAQSDIPIVVMVSCNPASFARDARALKEQGFALTRVVGVDQFVWSAHVEMVAVFRR